MSEYDLEDLHLPALKGRMLSLAAHAFDAPLVGRIASEALLEGAGFERARRHVTHAPPTLLPLWPAGDAPQGAPATQWLQAPVGDAPRFAVARSRDFHLAYQRGSTTPEAIAERVLDAQMAFDKLSPPLRAFIAIDREDVRQQARASAARYRAGQPLGVLDGVPVAIKDELDQTPYPTTGGTSFWGKTRSVTQDATVVARLRAQGALLIGKANMHEIGIQPNGMNVHYGQVRNPFERGHDSGGSSSGSAAATAAGLCPIAIGADGGGSVRVPAALCGIAGLKATFGRISEHGALPLCWSVAHVGPLGASIEDVALAYAAIAGLDTNDPNTMAQPTPTLDGLLGLDLKGVRVGVYRDWFEHADRAIVDACESALRVLESFGAQRVEVTVPRLDLMRVAHSVSILSEMVASLGEHPESPRALSPSVRMTVLAAGHITAADYVWAQRVRTELIAQWGEMMKGIDMLVTPTSAITAPRLPDPLPPSGWSDVSSTLAVMRFIVAGNFLGLPGLSVPVGYDAQGLPIGMHLSGRAWEEALLLRAGRLIETRVERRRPSTFVDLLGG